MNFTILSSILHLSEKVINYHYDYIHYSTFARDWAHEIKTGIDDREQKVDIGKIYIKKNEVHTTNITIVMVLIR